MPFVSDMLDEVRRVAMIVEGRGDRECGPGTAQGLRPQGERAGKGLAGERGT